MTTKLLRLLEKHGLQLHRLLVKVTLDKDVADDLLQDLFLRLRDAKGFHNSPSPERYLFRSAINLAFDWRKQSTRFSVASGFVEDFATVVEYPLDKVIHSEELHRVLEAMEQLNVAHRELVTLRYIQGMSFDEVAELSDSTPHRIRAKCAKAIARLRKLVGVTNKGQ